jgi:hypothetical protein
MKCRSLNCPSPPVDGSRFCELHRDLFASVAAEIEEGKEARLRSPERRNRRTMFKECDWPDCSECAAPRESYCAMHVRALARSPGAAQN